MLEVTLKFMTISSCIMLSMKQDRGIRNKTLFAQIVQVSRRKATSRLHSVRPSIRYNRWASIVPRSTLYGTSQFYFLSKMTTTIDKQKLFASAIIRSRFHSKQLKNHLTVFCPTKGLSKIGCQTNFVYKHLSVLSRLMENFEILGLFNFFSISEVLNRTIYSPNKKRW